MKYQTLWTDMHSNIHHQQIQDLDRWYQHIKELMDFWPIAYYPFDHQKLDGVPVEDLIPQPDRDSDWELIRQKARQAQQEGFPMFMGYEWQGNGEDGDHNVFFQDNDQAMKHPLTYQELYETYKDVEAIAIPHHPAYQLGFRGKNWATQIDEFSPFCEIYSSHGCSENDEISLAMNRHVHMGPRTDDTCGQKGYEFGHRYGLIASNDAHVVPGRYFDGTMGLLARDNSKQAIWEAMKARRVFGVSRDRIWLDFTLDGQEMGGSTTANPQAQLAVDATGSDTIDRIEVVADNRTVMMIPHLVQPEAKETVRFKFKLEFGWSPDPGVFPEETEKIWDGVLRTAGHLWSVTRCFNDFGQQVLNQDDHQCAFSLRITNRSKEFNWMGGVANVTEALIFEIECPRSEILDLTLNGKHWQLPVEELLAGAKVYAMTEETDQKLAAQYGYHGFYRQDATWRNTYKFKTSKASLQEEYTVHDRVTIDTTRCSHVRLRIWQKNGSVAWSSPVFIDRPGE